MFYPDANVEVREIYLAPGEAVASDGFSGYEFSSFVGPQSDALKVGFITHMNSKETVLVWRNEFKDLRWRTLVQIW